MIDKSFLCVVGKVFLLFCFFTFSACEDIAGPDDVMQVSFDPEDGQTGVPADQNIIVKTNLSVYTIGGASLGGGNAHELFTLSETGSRVDLVDTHALIAVDYGPGLAPYNRFFDKERRPHTFVIRPPKLGMDRDGYTIYAWRAGEYMLTMDNFKDAWGRRYGPISISFQIAQSDRVPIVL